jgi:formamidopyrimidine-DNA glycosylase
MPELPEVETLKRALVSLVLNKRLLDLTFLRKNLRFPIPLTKIRKGLLNQTVSKVTRKGKYILLHVPDGALLIHLGMSGRFNQAPSMEPIEKHTHAIFKFDPDVYLHYIDPRRFGCLLWVPNGQGHPLLNSIGPDPLGKEITPTKIKLVAKTCKKVSIKNFLMDSKRIAGVGNIYACETLFAARISPKKIARRIKSSQWTLILSNLRDILQKSIVAGGTTLRDFHSTDGNQGYYKFSLAVYGKENEPCLVCAKPIKRIIQSARSTFYCKTCQKS